MNARTSSIPQLCQELLRVKYQLRPGCRGYDDRFCVDFLVFFENGDSDFREFVGANVAVVEEQGLFIAKKIEHVCRV